VASAEIACLEFLKVAFVPYRSVNSAGMKFVILAEQMNDGGDRRRRLVDAWDRSGAQGKAEGAGQPLFLYIIDSNRNLCRRAPGAAALNSVGS
jgi:hypothetical protein